MKLTQLLVRCSAVVGIGIATLGQSAGLADADPPPPPGANDPGTSAHSGYPYTSAHSRLTGAAADSGYPRTAADSDNPGSAADPSDSRPQFLTRAC